MLSIACCIRLLGNPKIKKKTSRLNIKFGIPILEVSYEFITIIVGTFYFNVAVNMLYALKLLISAVNIRNHVGFYINLVSKGDGNVLPNLQAIPTVFFFLIDCISIYLVVTVFTSDKKRPKMNWALYFVVLANIILIAIILMLLIVTIVHSHGTHDRLHNGLLEAMKKYSKSPKTKSQIDRLQIELQCCGSKKYDEWYDIQWYDPELNGVGIKNSESQTPFSCCSMNSLFPCVHYNIEETGSIYYYTPEYNLSISTRGCYDTIRKRKKKVGWSIIGRLILFIILQSSSTILVRFIQTGHFEKAKFEGKSRTYIIWVFGLYAGKNKNKKEPPQRPPLPPELMDSP